MDKLFGIILFIEADGSFTHNFANFYQIDLRGSWGSITVDEPSKVYTFNERCSFMSLLWLKKKKKYMLYQLNNNGSMYFF